MKERIRVVVQEEEEEACTGIGQQCPPPTIKVEKINGGLRIFGVLVGNNCKISLPAFGILFVFIGIILTIVAFQNPNKDEGRTELENGEEQARNIRVLGPVCVLVGVVMLVSALGLRYLSKKAKDRQTRIGFYCPVHGDFYPLSPGINPRKFSYFSAQLVPDVNSHDNKCWLTNCIKKHESADPIVPDIPTCPHSISPSNRSSFDAQPNINNPIPMAIVITAPINNDYAGSSDYLFSNDSQRSLSVPNDVASFPNYRSHSNPPTSPGSPLHMEIPTVKRLSCPILPEIGAISPLRLDKLTRQPQTSIVSTAKTELKMVQPATSSLLEPTTRLSRSSLYSDGDDEIHEMKKRKSVSIVLPAEEYHTRITH